ncbi:MAG: PorP/SprF family type IX secretion system membrane protein [Bacteroidetes bacterium]|nr:PorP/SprF family type IX secretion system membrane protein [Bacteroidota bacterium]
MKRFSTILFVLTIIGLRSIGQDLNFSQFYEVPLLRNPALSFSYKGDIRVTGAYRNQWSSVTVPYVSEALGFETKLAWPRNTDNFVSFGLQLTNDQAGDSRFGKFQVLPVFAYHKSMSDEKDAYLSIGVMPGAGFQHFNVSKLKFDDQYVNGQYDPSNPTQDVFSNTDKNYFDLSAGVVYSSSFANDIKYYAGLSAFHVNQPKANIKEIFSAGDEGKLNVKWMLSAGLAAPTSDADKFIIYADFFKQGGNNQAQGGFMFKHDLVENADEETTSISIGSFLRWNDAIIPVIKLDIFKFAIGFTYDVNTSKLKTASQSMGGFEASMSYHSYLNIHNTSRNSYRCPVHF